MIRTSCAWARVAPARACHPRNLFGANPTSSQSSPNTPHITKRHNASPPPVGQKAPETAKTIPGPSWLWLEPIYEPFRAYGRVQQRKPYMTQFVSSLVIYFVGDLVAQGISEPQEGAVITQEEEDEMGWVQKWSNERDWARTGRALVIGGVSSIPAYRWFLWLGNNFNYRSIILSLATKVTVNQIFFTPVFNSYFFGMQSLLSGATLPEIIERIKNTVPTSCINSLKVWPVATVFSFTYIPIQYRSIFGGVIAIGWQTYLSLLNQRAAALEKEQEKVEQKSSLESRAQEDDNGSQQERQKLAVSHRPPVRASGSTSQ